MCEEGMGEDGKRRGVLKCAGMNEDVMGKDGNEALWQVNNRVVMIRLLWKV